MEITSRVSHLKHLVKKNCPPWRGNISIPILLSIDRNALLQSGVNINTTRYWLGHTNLETTNHYSEINLEMKRKVLDNYLPISKRKRPWKQNKNLLQWLESL